MRMQLLELLNYRDDKQAYKGCDLFMACLLMYASFIAQLENSYSECKKLSIEQSVHGNL